MTTYTATNAASTVPVAGHGFGHTKKQAYGVYNVTASLAATDIIRLCRVPKGAIVTGGTFYGTKMETTSSGAALDIDIGYEANGTDSADPDAFGNNGVLITAAVSGVKPEADVFRYPLAGVLLATGPKTLAAETIISATVVASATSWASGYIGVVVDYELP
jgi:hypothetical protein